MLHRIPGSFGSGPKPTSATARSVLGTTTNDNAAAGNVGEYISSRVTFVSSTVPISNASPGIVSWTAHGLNIGAPINFTTTGALPTGLAVGTNYYVSSQSFTANSFAVSTSVSNALAGTSINTSSAGSGTHTALNFLLLTTGTIANLTGVSLTPGDWDVTFDAAFSPGGSTTSTGILASVSTTSGVLDLAPDRVGTVVFASGTVVGGGFDLFTFVPCARFSLSATTTVYAVVKALFGTASLNAYGVIRARRVR